jgi:hypothetical protein
MNNKKRKPDLGIWYSYTNMYLLKYCDNERLIYRKELLRIFGEVFHIDKLTRIKVLQEMQDYGYILMHKRERFGVLYKVLG